MHTTKSPWEADPKLFKNQNFKNNFPYGQIKNSLKIGIFTEIIFKNHIFEKYTSEK